MVNNFERSSSSFINICSIVTFLSIRDLPTGKVLSQQVKLEEVSNREER